jgi:transcriptional regulator with XRE-family HTH domain
MKSSRMICSFDNVGKLLKNLRRQQYITQKALSIEANCSNTAVSVIEKRREKTLTLECLENVFSALGYDIKFIIIPREMK